MTLAEAAGNLLDALGARKECPRGERRNGEALHRVGTIDYEQQRCPACALRAVLQVEEAELAAFAAKLEQGEVAFTGAWDPERALVRVRLVVEDVQAHGERNPHPAACACPEIERADGELRALQADALAQDFDEANLGPQPVSAAPMAFAVDVTLTPEQIQAESDQGAEEACAEALAVGPEADEDAPLTRCPRTKDGRLPLEELGECEACPGTTYCRGDVNEPPADLAPACSSRREGSHDAGSLTTCDECGATVCDAHGPLCDDCAAPPVAP